MIIHDFLSWVETAPDGPRAEAAGALARAWLYSDLDAETRRDAAAALTLLLEDPCEDVRMALAENLARSEEAPRHLILALAQEQGEAAPVVYAHSPLFSDVELIDGLGHPDPAVHEVIARRNGLSAAVAAAIAEVADRSACQALLANRSARLVPGTLRRLAERFADEGMIREQLLKVSNLPLDLRHVLLLAHASSLGEAEQQEKEELLSDASDRFALRLMQSAPDDQLHALALSLRTRGLLNTRLLLRAVCCGRFRFFAMALSLLSDVSEERVARALFAARPSSMRAVLRKASLPMRTHQAFLLAIDIAREGGADLSEDLPLSRARGLTERLLAELQDEALGSDGDILGFLRRFSIEVARLEARDHLKQSGQKALSAA
ncbi:DUF2336 domain-containing protein [Roseibium sp.]|uniref:DUF2336 domain-containing protein n=1 Tax=Roseibium sp. TaxID=1936156 RepID=UPI003A96AB1D